MKNAFIYLLLISSLSFCSNKEKKFKHFVTNEEQSLDEMAADSSFTVFYCWTDWCGPCLSAMKTTLLRSKEITDSLGLPIEYNAILYSWKMKDRPIQLMKNAYAEGIEVFHKTSANALTQKLAISADFKHYKGFEKEFSVPRIILVNKKGKLLTSYFPLAYNQEQFIAHMKKQFPNYVN